MERVGFSPILNDSSRVPGPSWPPWSCAQCVLLRGTGSLTSVPVLLLGCVCVGGAWAGAEAGLFSRVLGSCARADLLIHLIPLKLLSKSSLFLLIPPFQNNSGHTKTPDPAVCASLLSVSSLNKVPCCNRCHNSKISFIRL